MWWLQTDGTVTKEQNYPWNAELDHTIIDGVPFYYEIVFFHRQSRTLIITDLAVHICETKSWKTKFFLSIIGSFGQFGWSSLEKKIFIKDKVEFQQALAAVLHWDFDKIIMAHGSPVISDGKRQLQQAFL